MYFLLINTLLVSGVHGYIDYPSSSSEPTQIVEISSDMFDKEVYDATESVETLPRPDDSSHVSETVTIHGESTTTTLAGNVNISMFVKNVEVKITEKYSNGL